MIKNEKNKPYFYKITNIINGRYYYGSGKKNNYLGSGCLLKNAYDKYGIENFEFEILKYFEDRKSAFLFEDRFLKFYNISTDDLSYNLCDCAGGGDTISTNPNRDKIIEKMSKSKIEYLRENPPIGENNNFYNKNHTEETKKRWSENRKGDKNPAYGISVKDRLGDSYEDWKKSCSRPGRQNGRYGKSLMDIWTGKYGLVEARRREKSRVEKRRINKLNKLSK